MGHRRTQGGRALDAVSGGSGELLERSGEFATLAQRLAAVTDGKGGGLGVIGGEAGVGKTSLVRSFCAGRWGTATVLWGTCDALFTPRALGPLVTVSERLGANWPRSWPPRRDRTRSLLR